MKLKTYQLVVQNVLPEEQKQTQTTSEACETIPLLKNVFFFVFSGMNRKVTMPQLKMQLNKMCLLSKRLSY
jgi:hypothetical protein